MTPNMLPFIGYFFGLSAGISDFKGQKYFDIVACKAERPGPIWHDSNTMVKGCICI